jgi:GNAT superfamily N-acetyltransferase
MNTANKSITENVYDLVTGDEDARVCKDIPSDACNDQPRNFFAYLAANFLGKIADELASAKLVLPWLLAIVGAPAAFTGFLVPIREAGVLVPQLIVAATIRRLAIRKGVWLLGAALSGVVLAAMAVAVALFSGAKAGWAIVLLLVVFSLARGLCSVSAKDVLGKTVSKGRRGILMGYSAALAGIATLALGLYIQWFVDDTAEIGLMVTLLVVGALLWGIAMIFFAAIREQPGATEGGGNALTAALQSLGRLKTDPALRQFVIARALLLSVALAPPFYALLAQQQTQGALAGLGLMIIASGLASSLSAPFWGKLGDKSSRLVMVSAAFAAGVLSIMLFVFVEFHGQWLAYPLMHALLFLALTVFHSGVRLGRKVYLVDLATAETRATYVAISNTVIGVAMLLGGAIGVLADVLAVHYVILCLGVLAVIAALYTLRLPEVSH